LCTADVSLSLAGNAQTKIEFSFEQQGIFNQACKINNARGNFNNLYFKCVIIIIINFVSLLAWRVLFVAGVVFSLKKYTSTNFEIQVCEKLDRNLMI